MPFEPVAPPACPGRPRRRAGRLRHDEPVQDRQPGLPAGPRAPAAADARRRDRQRTARRQRAGDPGRLRRRPTSSTRRPRCLDEPPGFFRRTGGAVAGSPEEAVNVWAMAWASRKADQVAAFYSPAFQSHETRRRRGVTSSNDEQQVDERQGARSAARRSQDHDAGQRSCGRHVRAALRRQRRAQGTDAAARPAGLAHRCRAHARSALIGANEADADVPPWPRAGSRPR